MLKNPQNLDLLFHFRFINDFRRDPLPKKDPKTDPFLGFGRFPEAVRPKTVAKKRK